MSTENLHEKREDLTGPVLDAHRAYTSLIEELEAVDWYHQRAEATEDVSLKEILIHNMEEEMEHACMLFEWIRRTQKGWNQKMSTYLFKQEEIINLEEEEENEAEIKSVKQDLEIGQLGKMKG
jgi:ferritin-like protein